MSKFRKLIELDEEVRVSLQKIADTQDRSLNYVINDVLKKSVTVPVKKKASTGKGINVNTKPIIEIPNYIDGQLWLDYIDMRKVIKKPATDQAIKNILRDFEKWHGEGFDCNQALKDSINSSWAGVFQPKEKRNNDLFGEQLGDWMNEV